MHNSRIKRISLAVCLALMPFAADAAGLGRLTVLSGLGEPLRAEIDLSASKEELSSLSARVAPAETYAEQGIERSASLGGIRVELGSKPDGSPVLKLSTPQPVNDPFLDMLIQVDWPTGRLLREYTALLDPPGYGERSSLTAPVAGVGASAPAIKTPSKPRAGRPEKAAPVAGESYRTKPGDTLRSVAREMQVEDVSLEQMLVGLYRANRNAFAGDNMNQLKVGQIMRVPHDEDLRSVSQQEALQEVRVHAANWNTYRSKLADVVAQSAPTRDKSRQQAASGKIAASTEDMAALPVTGPRDVVKLSESDAQAVKAGTAEGRGGVAEDKLKALAEQSTAQEKAIKEASERIAFFEKQIQDMQKLLLVQNQMLADLQQGKPVSQPQPTPAPPHAGEQPKPATPAPKQPAETAPEPGLLDVLMEDPRLLGGAGSLLVLLGGAWLYLRSRRKKGLDSFEQGILTTGGLKPETVFGTMAGGAGDAGQSSLLADFSRSAHGDMIDTSDVDPVSEAEVYMAYGRDAQAEEILKDAIVKEPRRYELHHKLLEIYANRKDAVAFETLAGELYAILGAADPNWHRIAELGQTVEPGNPMYASGTSATAVPPAAEQPVPAAQMAGEPSAANSSPEQPLNAAASEVGQLPARDNSLDFDFGKPTADENAGKGLQFDLPEPAAPDNLQLEAADLGMPPAEPTSEGTAESSLEFPELAVGGAARDAGLELPAAEVTQQAAGESGAEVSLDFPRLAAAERVGEETPALELPSLVQESKEGAPVPAAAAAEVEEIIFDTTPSPGSDLDFDFNIDIGAEAPAEQASPATPSVLPDLDLSGIRLDMGEGGEAEIGAAEEITLTGAESSDVDTKLDLVTAYMDMGDSEGARELLAEVLNEGGPQQRKRAQKLLDSLG